MEKIATAKESHQINAVPTAQDEQVYRGLVLKHMEDQLLQGMENDPRALEIQRVYEEQCRKFPAGSAQHVTAHMEYENQLKIRRDELNVQLNDEAQRASWYRLGQSTAAFAETLSVLTGSKNVRQFGQAIAGVVQAFKGFNDMASAATSIATEGVGVSNMGTMIGGCTAVLGVTLMCMQLIQDEDTEENGLSEALNAIYAAIRGMWTEMRSSFAETWHMLETMEAYNAKRFCLTKAYLEQIISDISYTRHQQKIGFARIQAQLGLMHTELTAGLNDVLDQNCLLAIAEIRQGDAAYLEAHYPSVISRLLTYLTQDAASVLKTGYMPLPLDVQKTLYALRSFKPMVPLGLLAAVANSFKSNFVANPTGLIGGNVWVQVSQIYDDLIRYRGIPQEIERERIITEVSAVRNKATQICQFLEALTTPSTGNPLLNAVIAHYAENLEKALTCVKEIIEQERRRINREKLTNDQMSREAIAAIEDKVLLRLDETFEETNRRLIGTPTAFWQKPILKHSTFKYINSHSVEVANLPEVYKLQPISSLVCSWHQCPEIISLGSERLDGLKYWHDLQLERGNQQERWRDAAKFLFYLEMNPILNLSFTYGVSKDLGGLWWFNTRQAFRQLTRLNFIHNIHINATNLPIAVTQFVNPHRPIGGIVSEYTASKTSVDVNDYHMDSNPITPLITETALVNMVETELTSILNRGRQRVATALSANNSFTDTLQQMELSRLFITAYLERLGVVLTPQQKDLFVSEQKINDLLEKLETTPSVIVIKELLTCLDLKQLRIDSISASVTTSLATLQNAWCNIVPRDAKRLSLYQEIHKAGEKLARLAYDLRSMPVRAPKVQESTDHVPLDITREMQALREDNHQLRSTLEETNARLNAMQGTMNQLLQMMQHMSRSVPVSAAELSESRTVHNPRLF